MFYLFQIDQMILILAAKSFRILLITALIFVIVILTRDGKLSLHLKRTGKTTNIDFLLCYLAGLLEIPTLNIIPVNKYSMAW